VFGFGFDFVQLETLQEYWLVEVLVVAVVAAPFVEVSRADCNRNSIRD
jgi:hypothetical protein